MNDSPQKAVATFGGGCFWCVEAVFTALRGVVSVKSGYAGGTTENPSYREVCTGRTGHAEVVRIEFDPAIISFRDLLAVFLTTHDPTTLNRQGHDVGTQYRSVILWHDTTQEREARAVIADFNRSRLWPNPIVTDIAPLDRFYPAEPEHDDYFARHPRQPYCQAVIAPKVAKLRKYHYDKLKNPVEA